MGLRSLESTPSSSSGSLNSLNVVGASGQRPPVLAQASTGLMATSFELSSPIYQCASLHESRGKNLCRKQPLRMLEHTLGKLKNDLLTHSIWQIRPLFTQSKWNMGEILGFSWLYFWDSSKRKPLSIKWIYLIERRSFDQKYKFSNKNDMVCAWRNFQNKFLLDI
jgi:hypothetical protein